MNERFLFAILTLVIVASAGINSIGDNQVTAKPVNPAQKPLAFARFDKADSNLIAQLTGVPPHCGQSKAFRDPKLSSTLITYADACAPFPTLISANDPKGTKAVNWELPKSPLRIIWQQDVLQGQRLTVELLDSDKLPWPARFESSRLNDKETVQVIPNYELHADREIYLVANLYTQSNERLEHWVLPITLKSGSTSSTPWSGK